MKPPPVRTRIFIVGLVAVVSVAVWLVRTGRIGRRPAPSNLVTLYGNVDIRQVELGFRVAGRVQSMAFEEGESVRAGAVMAELDPRALHDDLQAATANVAVQEATLKKLVAGSRPAELARGHATVQEAEAAAEHAHVDLERAQRLLADGAIPHATYDDAVAQAREADARLSSARDSHRLLVEGTRAEDIAAAQATLQVVQARVASAQTSLDDTRLLAPSDGVVISRVREPGAIVGPNDVVFVLSLTRSVWVRAYVSETELGKLHPGMEVSVQSDAAPSSFKGHVGFISPTAEFTPKSVETPELRTDLVYRLRVIVDDAGPGLRQGMPVTVQIPTGGV